MDHSTLNIIKNEIEIKFIIKIKYILFLKFNKLFWGVWCMRKRTIGIFPMVRFQDAPAYASHVKSLLYRTINAL